MAKTDWQFEVRVASDVTADARSPARALDPDRPFVIIALGDFTGETTRADTATDLRAHAIDIDIDNVDSVLARCGPRWRGSLQGLPERANSRVPIEIVFQEIDDFHPDRLLQRIAPLRALLDTRQALADPARFERVAGEIASWAQVRPRIASVEPSRPAAPPPPRDPTDLLGQIVAEASNEPSAVPVRPDDLQRFIESVVVPHVVTTDRARQAEYVAAVDGVLARQLRSILHDTAFQSLEAAWRGLRWLVRRIGGEAPVQLKIASLPRRHLDADAAAGAAPPESLLGRLVLDPSQARPALLVGNYTFSSDSGDVRTLRHLGAIAQMASVPFVGAAACALLGCESFVAMPPARELARRFAAPECEEWHALRRSPAAHGLALALPRFLGRLPYGPSTEPIEAFDFEEIARAGDHAALLWTNPAFAVAAVAAAGFSAQGWALDIATEAQHVDDLPLYVYDDDGLPVTKACAEVLLTDAQVEELSRAGLLPLVSSPGRDAVLLPCVQTLADPRKALCWA